MSLSFLHGGIALFGLAAAAVPILIHLLLRQKPRTIVFPALQLLRNRKTTTVKRLRLQNFLLLALRILVLALMGIALARPTLRSGLFSIDQKAPVAAVFIFDSSLSMEYKQRGKTRLDEAKELARQVLNKLPENSEISLMDSSNPAVSVPLDVPNTIGRLDKIELQAVSRPLNSAIMLACRTLGKSLLDRREIHVFTDLAGNSWNLAPEAGEEIEQGIGLVGTGVRIYVLNVGVEKPENISIAPIQLPQQILPASMELSFPVTIQNSGPEVDRMLTLSVDGEARDTRPIRLPAGQSVEVAFRLPPLGEGVHQGELAINAGDAMPFDDVRFFTVEVRPPVRVLAVYDELLDMVNLGNALAPEVLRAQKRASYDVTAIPSRLLATQDLQGFAMVALLNVGAPTLQAWNRLSNFVQAGGGLFVGLGDRIDPANYNSPEAQEVLPGKLVREMRPEGGVTFAPDQFSHPLVAKFRQFENTDMSVYPVLRYWKVEPREKGTVVVLPYSNRDAGLLERTFGEGKRGRTVLLSTAAHYRPSPNYWSEFPRSWSYVVLMDQMARYMAGLVETKLNFVAGSQVTFEIEPGLGLTLFAVTDPTKVIERFSIDPSESILAIPSTRRLGNYRVESAEADRKFVKGFSINEPLEESQLTPIDGERLTAVLGKDRLSLARDPNAIESVLDEARVGRELFSWVMLLVIAAVCIEGFLANRFYRKPSTEPVVA